MKHIYLLLLAAATMIIASSCSVGMGVGMGSSSKCDTAECACCKTHKCTPEMIKAGKCCCAKKAN